MASMLAFPLIYLLPAHMTDEELISWEKRLPALTYDAGEASVLVGKTSSPHRVRMELRRVGIEVDSEEEAGTQAMKTEIEDGKLVFDLTGDSDEEVDAPNHEDRLSVRVVRLAWLEDSLAADKVLPLKGYVVFEGRRCMKRELVDHTEDPIINTALRASQEKTPETQPYKSVRHSASHRSPGQRWQTNGHTRSKLLHLVPESTVEHEINENLPDIPEELQSTYSCTRATRSDHPNKRFTDELKKVREIRLMTGDQIGVRAYSTAIASLSAYPYVLQSSAEIDRLPGCGFKIAVVYQDFIDNGSIEEVRIAEDNEEMQIIKTFYNIWGVAAVTAKDFYHDRAWRSLDDIVDYGWANLSRSQQIGVKYYDEFLQKLSRVQVEQIADTILQHARKINSGFQMVIVGGYRRGKEESNDVDVILSHPDEAVTHESIGSIIVALEESKHITHTLTFSTANSDRGQMPLGWHGDGKKGSGFDTLDKALCVWQDPVFAPPASIADEHSEPPVKLRNSNPHRRVDIIMSPWKTVGCAVLGWTSATTFQRDLRRYCKYEKRLKFDSSGIRSRVDGAWMDFEHKNGVRATTMLEAEKMVFDGLGLTWREPEERCTG